MKKSIFIYIFCLFFLLVIWIDPKIYDFGLKSRAQIQIFNWLLVIPIIFVIERLRRLSQNEDSSPNWLQKSISPFLVIIGFACIIVATPNYIAYNSAPFNLLYRALPSSLVAAILVWTGLLSIKGKQIIVRIGSAILTGVVSSILIYNLAGVCWLWSR